jgi:hypothetical protein
VSTSDGVLAEALAAPVPAVFDVLAAFFLFGIWKKNSFSIVWGSRGQFFQIKFNPRGEVDSSTRV